MEPHSLYCSPVWQLSNYEDNNEVDVEYRQLDDVYSDPVLNSTIWKHKDSTSSSGTEPLIEQEDDNSEGSNETEEIIIKREEITSSCSSNSACSSNSNSDNESVSNIPLPSESWIENRKRKVNSYVPKNTNPFLTDSFEEQVNGGQKKMKINEQCPDSDNCEVLTENKQISAIVPKQKVLPSGILDWILQFQHWPHEDKLLALNELIDDCDPTYVRHMMRLIEPQFQRDFISLLPKELALHVLSYLDPHDLLVAAQTCRYWRSLCDDNLLWREKCLQAKIELKNPPIESKHHNHHHHHHHSHRHWNSQVPIITVPSAWKAAFLRHQRIQMNWRVNPIKRMKVLKGHDDHVITCLQFCGNRIVSGSDDNTLKVWSVTSGKCLRTLVGHTGGVWSSQMSGNLVISGSTDRTLKVWDLDSGDCLHTLYGHTSTVRCMHLHGDIVVSGSRDTTLRVWEVLTGNCVHVLMGHLAAVRCVQYDGRLVVSGAYDYTVKVWDPETETCLHTLSGHTNRVYSLQFDGIHVVSGSLDTSIKVWDVETGELKHTLMGHQSLTSGMELRNDILVSGNADSTVKVWNITTGKCLQTLSGSHKHQSAVTCLQFNSRFVITSSDDGTVKLWDVTTGEFIRNLVTLSSGGNGGVVWRIRASDTKLVCAVGSRNGTEETKLIVLDFDEELDYA